MSPRPFDPRALDVEAFAAQGGALSGEWPQREMPRLLSVAHEGVAGAETVVVWRADAERAPLKGRQPQIWLRLALATPVVLTCQRCLGPLDVTLDVKRRFGFVVGEDEAAALDAETDDDVLALARTLDLRELAEDELLLALPLVPMHSECSLPATPGDGEPPGAAREHPFAALAVLKRGAH